uniref:ankycorbin-like n=1 Tax=Myxine glutinosa TaxID=7769 RepID=UPI003590069D
MSAGLCAHTMIARPACDAPEGEFTAGSEIPTQGAEWNRQDERLIQAVEDGDLERVVRFLQRKACATHLDPDGRSAFHLAAARGFVDCLDAMLLHGVDVGATDAGGQTALHLAAKYCQPVCVKRLVQPHGVHVCYTAMGGCILSAQILCDNGASVNIQDEEGKSPLALASHFAFPDICRYLVAQGAEVNTSDRQGRTPLMEACQGDHESIERLMHPSASSLQLEPPPPPPPDNSESSRAETPLPLPPPPTVLSSPSKLVQTDLGRTFLVDIGRDIWEMQCVVNTIMATDVDQESYATFMARAEQMGVDPVKAAMVKLKEDIVSLSHYNDEKQQAETSITQPTIERATQTLLPSSSSNDESEDAARSEKDLIREGMWENVAEISAEAIVNKEAQIRKKLNQIRKKLDKLSFCFTSTTLQDREETQSDFADMYSLLEAIANNLREHSNEVDSESKIIPPGLEWQSNAEERARNNDANDARYNETDKDLDPGGLTLANFRESGTLADVTEDLLDTYRRLAEMTAKFERSEKDRRSMESQFDTARVQEMEKKLAKMNTWLQESEEEKASLQQNLNEKQELLSDVTCEADKRILELNVKLEDSERAKKLLEKENNAKEIERNSIKTLQKELPNMTEKFDDSECTKTGMGKLLEASQHRNDGGVIKEMEKMLSEITTKYDEAEHDKLLLQQSLQESRHMMNILEESLAKVNSNYMESLRIRDSLEKKLEASHTQAQSMSEEEEQNLMEIFRKGMEQERITSEDREQGKQKEVSKIFEDMNKRLIESEEKLQNSERMRHLLQKDLENYQQNESVKQQALERTLKEKTMKFKELEKMRTSLEKRLEQLQQENSVSIMQNSERLEEMTARCKEAESWKAHFIQVLEQTNKGRNSSGLSLKAERDFNDLLNKTMESDENKVSIEQQLQELRESFQTQEPLIQSVSATILESTDYEELRRDQACPQKDGFQSWWQDECTRAESEEVRRRAMSKYNHSHSTFPDSGGVAGAAPWIFINATSPDSHMSPEMVSSQCLEQSHAEVSSLRAQLADLETRYANMSDEMLRAQQEAVHLREERDDAKSQMDKLQHQRQDTLGSSVEDKDILFPKVSVDELQNQLQELWELLKEKNNKIQQLQQAVNSLQAGTGSTNGTAVDRSLTATEVRQRLKDLQRMMEIERKIIAFYLLIGEPIL